MFHTRPARKVRAYRPRLEVLEDRQLLSTYLVGTCLAGPTAEKPGFFAC